MHAASVHHKSIERMATVGGGGGGSQYEDYDSTSKTYDSGRQAIGLPLILGAFASTARKLHKELQQLNVLDAGCGTGNYSKALSPFVESVTGLEYSKGMFEQAREKTEKLGNVKLQQGDITDMPFPDKHFAGITINQVLHHLSRPNGDMCQVEKFFKEAHRVLVPGGVLVINTSFSHQVNTFWFSTIIPNAKEKNKVRLPPADYILSKLAEFGFLVDSTYALLSETLIKPEVYLQKEGPLDKSWRNMDSMWALATPAELESGFKQWKEKLRSGEADKIIAEFEEKRKQVGVTTTIVALKQ